MVARSANSPACLPSLGLALLLLMTFGCSSDHASSPHVLLRRDLRDFGYREPGYERGILDYSQISFLSDKELLISINQITTGPVVPLHSDTPASRVLILDMASGNPLAQTSLPVKHFSGAIHAVQGNRFAMLNMAGIQICGADLRCGPPLAALGQMFVSPKGRTIAYRYFV